MRWTQEKVTELLRKAQEFNKRELCFINEDEYFSLRESYNFIPIEHYGYPHLPLDREVGTDGVRRYIVK